MDIVKTYSGRSPNEVGIIQRHGAPPLGPAPGEATSVGVWRQMMWLSSAMVLAWSVILGTLLADRVVVDLLHGSAQAVAKVIIAMVRPDPAPSRATPQQPVQAPPRAESEAQMTGDQPQRNEQAKMPGDSGFVGAGSDNLVETNAPQNSAAAAEQGAAPSSAVSQVGNESEPTARAPRVAADVPQRAASSATPKVPVRSIDNPVSSASRSAPRTLAASVIPPPQQITPRGLRSPAERKLLNPNISTSRRPPRGGAVPPWAIEAAVEPQPVAAVPHTEPSVETRPRMAPAEDIDSTHAR